MIRNQQRMWDGLDSNGGRRGHAGAKQQFVIVDRDLCKVGDHVVGGGRAVSNNRDGARKLPAGISIHGEEHVLTNLDLAYIGLIDVDL